MEDGDDSEEESNLRILSVLLWSSGNSEWKEPWPCGIRAGTEQGPRTPMLR